MTVRSALSMLLALVLGAACAVLVACGGGGGNDEGLIPGGRAEALLRELDRVDREVRTGDCESVGGSVSRLQEEVNALSNDVDAGLRTRLQAGVDNLAEIAPDECLDGQRTETTDTTETTETTETVPPETTETTTPTETVPPETTQTTEPPVETSPPPVETTPPPVETIPDTGGGATVPPSGSGSGGTGGAQPTP